MQNFNENNDWWKPAMFFYAKVTSWIIFPVILAIVFSEYFFKENVQNITFFILIFISFVITCFGIYKEIKEYKNSINKDGNK
jgi:hypothetical protein